MAGRQLDVHMQVSGEQLNVEMNVGESGAEMVFQAIRLDQITSLQMISNFQNCFSCPCRFEIYVLFFFSFLSSFLSFFKLFTLLASFEREPDWMCVFKCSFHHPILYRHL